MFNDFMKQAIEQAYKAFEMAEIPVGAVITYKNKIIASGHNLTRTNNDPTAHAEMVVIRRAAQILGNYRLNDCHLYVTLEPCVMCAGAISHARIARLYFGATDLKAGAVTSGVRFFHHQSCHHKIDIYDGINQEKCAHLMKNFFHR